MAQKERMSFDRSRSACVLESRAAAPVRGRIVRDSESSRIRQNVPAKRSGGGDRQFEMRTRGRDAGERVPPPSYPVPEVGVDRGDRRLIRLLLVPAGVGAVRPTVILIRAI